MIAEIPDFRRSLKFVISKSNANKNVKSNCLFGWNLDRIIFQLVSNSYIKNEIHESDNSFDKYFMSFYNDLLYNKNSMNFAGVSGVVWATNYLLKKKCILNPKYSISEDFAKTILECAIKMQEDNIYDLFSGSIGNVMTFTSVVNDFNDDNTKHILDYLTILEKSADYDNSSDGLKWISYHLTRKEKIYNLGLSHGNASVIAILCKFIETINNEVIQKKTKSMLLKSINYMLSNEIDYSKYNCHFPNYSVEYYKGKIARSRLAWCYGDLGIAYTLLRASKCLNDNKLYDKSIRILIDASNRTDYTYNSIYNPWFCHGTAGNAHIFRKTYELTRESIFRNSANFWINETIKMIENDYEDYVFIKVPSLKKDFFLNIEKDSNSILEGYPGIGLVLLGFLYNDDCEWDECFLLS
ncbi:MAG: hypothetical protein PHP52_03550 [Bacteroidales bacterium]|nr:hypothetical protein [Bacteroidales bacterium]MDY0142356.1 lanthionine synthetase LanC family protein [Bacteroidales bacterium]